MNLLSFPLARGQVWSTQHMTSNGTQVSLVYFHHPFYSRPERKPHPNERSQQQPQHLRGRKQQQAPDRNLQQAHEQVTRLLEPLRPQPFPVWIRRQEHLPVGHPVESASHPVREEERRQRRGNVTP